MQQNFIDLFCGAGGLTWGFHKAGFNPLAAIDTDTKACRTHEINFSQTGCLTLNEDLARLDPARLRRVLGRAKPKISLIVGGPPCQGWSKAGRAKIRSLRKGNYSLLNDPRNKLYKKFIQAAAYFKPDFVIMENVPGMRAVEGENVAELVTADFLKAGFSAYSELVNASWFGVPQNRERLFFIAFPKSRKFLIPQGALRDYSKEFRRRFSLSESVSVKEAITDLPTISRGAQKDPLPYRPEKSLTAYQSLMRSTPAAAITDHVVRFNRQDEEAFKLMKPGMHYSKLPSRLKRYRDDIFVDKYRRLHSAKPSGTITAHLAHDGYSHIHPTQCRTISVREAARLQSFSDSFRFFGGMGDRFRQVGNAVPPLMAWGVAEFVASLQRGSRGRSAASARNGNHV